ncbi:MAG TPA: DUF1569 domain-containing protein [Nitrosopumilaceae archaeon]|jgi:hypothetical protein|nr:DUF1569 domain-containing protein [Nitrosopumilaceae archaeon]
MYNLFDSKNATEILNRIEKLKPDTQRKWGKMDVAQMMAHCAVGLKNATSDVKVPRAFMGVLLGGMIKPILTNEKPYKKNIPTDKSFLVTDARNFEKEKANLVTLIKSFQQGGATALTKHPHPFFGKLSDQEWSGAMHKHLDHHLQQFGV